MRNYFTAIFALFMTINVMAQPQAFKYQTVVRDSEGEIVANQTVSFQMKILQGSPAGTEVYAETHTATTNQFGLANLEIGNGTVVSGDFETIDWGADDYFIEISFDITGGTDYLLAGTSQLMAVPYALYAKESGSGSTWEAGEGGIYYNNGYVGIGTTSPGTRLKIVEESLPQPLQIESTSQFYTGLNLKNNHDHMNGNVDSWSVLMGTRKSGGYEGLVNGCFAIRQHSPGVDYSRLVIDQDGRVGIGTISPSRLLHLSGGDALIETPEWADLTVRTTTAGTTSALNLRTATDGTWANDSLWQIANNQAHNNDLHFTFNVARKMTLSKEGYLGIGTDQPGSLLDIHGGTRFTVRLNNDTRSKVGNLYSSDDTLALVSFGNVEISIDDNNTSTNKVFRVVNNGNNELFRVQDNGRVGIGTNNPTSQLHVSGGNALFTANSDCELEVHTLSGLKSGIKIKQSGVQPYYTKGWGLITNSGNLEFNYLFNYDETNKMVLTSSGNLGLGIANPDSRLEVNGKIKASEMGIVSTGDATFSIERFTDSHGGIKFYETGETQAQWIFPFFRGWQSDNLIIRDEKHYKDVMTFQYGTGRVGIGTSDPTHTLSVNGTIRSKEVIVNTGWSDFVFEEDYNLRSLKDLENFIINNKHLPDIPSAKDVEENGVSLGNMDSKLLQKIEELTLYIIDQQKMINDLKMQNEIIMKKFNGN